MIADYMFNKTAVAAGSRLCIALVKDPLTSAELGALVGKTVADLKALTQVLAVATPDVEVGSFGFKSMRSKTSAYGISYVPAFSLPTKCVYVPVASGVVRHVILVLMDGQTATAKAVRCYQCTAALKDAEATLSRINVSKEDRAFNAKLAFGGTPGQQIGDMEKSLRTNPVSMPVQQSLSVERTVKATVGSVTAVKTSPYVVETVGPSPSVVV